MKRLFVLLFSLPLLPVVGWAQSANTLFSESNYAPVSRGADPENPFNKYVAVYKNNSDPAYTMKKVYLDSAYADLMSVSFFKANVPEGPFFVYAKGKVALQGAYKNGKWDGERKTYMNEVLVQKAYFNDGVPSGAWEEYNLQGQLKRKITYDNSGKLVSDVRF